MQVINFILIAGFLLSAIAYADHWANKERTKQPRHRRTGKYMSKPKQIQVTNWVVGPDRS